MKRRRKRTPHAARSPRQALPPRRVEARGTAAKWVWRWALPGGLLTLAILLAISFWRPAPPPIPAVDTDGFDPAIAAAVAQARDAAQKQPRSAAMRGRMGMVLLAHEIRAAARDCFEQAMAMAPQEPRWPYFLGLAQAADHPAAALAHFQRAARLFPANESAPRLRMAETMLTLGQVEEARAVYEQVREREPDSAVAALGLGRVAHLQGRLSEAEEYLKAALEDPSTRKAAYRLLLSGSRRLGDTDQAEQIARLLDDLPNDQPMPDPFLDEVEQLKTGEEVWLEHAREWIEAGRAAEAAELMEKAIQAYPKSARAMFFLGRARLRLGDVAGAEAVLAQAVQLAPASVEAQMQLGVTRLRQGRPAEAQPCFRAAIQTNPNLGEAWFNLGLTLGREADRSECIAAFREAIRLKPDLVEAYLGLALALRADGHTEAAARELQRALKLDPPEPLRQKLLEEVRTVE